MNDPLIVLCPQHSIITGLPATSWVSPNPPSVLSQSDLSIAVSVIFRIKCDLILHDIHVLQIWSSPPPTFPPFLSLVFTLPTQAPAHLQLYIAAPTFTNTVLVLSRISVLLLLPLITQHLVNLSSSFKTY